MFGKSFKQEKLIGSVRPTRQFKDSEATNKHLLGTEDSKGNESTANGESDGNNDECLKTSIQGTSKRLNPS